VLAKTAAAHSQLVIPRPIRINSFEPHRGRESALASGWCTACARELVGGPVFARGSVFCSTECAAQAATPGIYLG
jgi:hypothetical protein